MRTQYKYEAGPRAEYKRSVRVMRSQFPCGKSTPRDESVPGKIPRKIPGCFSAPFSCWLFIRSRCDAYLTALHMARETCAVSGAFFLQAKAFEDMFGGQFDYGFSVFLRFFDFVSVMRENVELKCIFFLGIFRKYFSDAK